MDKNFTKLLLDTAKGKTIKYSLAESDEAIRKYMILYGHLSAMAAGDIDIAEMYFKILINNFNKCGTRDGRSCGTCGCSTNYIPSASHIVDHNCGCGK